MQTKNNVTCHSVDNNDSRPGKIAAFTDSEIKQTMSEQKVNPASLWRCFAAMLYDGFLLFALSFAYGAAATLVSTLLVGRPEDDYQPMFSSLLFPLGWLLTLLLFYGWFWRRSGQTLGMKAWRIKLISAESGNSPSWAQCFLRLALAIPAFFLLGLGYWYRFFNRDNLCFHDRYSGTYVTNTSP